ncbi:[SSU ribosomal protein S18P]-alanine acetyltransferase [Nitrosomonas aestuarii]|uniref:[Ribosomal protein bS18]-alanine N-acetyltransferase n=1 Tax=Nitrosomonas aestuarii TaxID=52441 RepID=A0A1I4AV21_9PROT|nr:ribosomal protein S18-alanine N-acetyltransferase [Nitrosomonas aestuarii]SFK60060.1 [SSU ribosomal protein S18P]-alanine acetyltransferase [Nitrosomonas aestuarii]
MNSDTQLNPDIRVMRESDLSQIILLEREIFLFPWSLENFASSIRAGYLCRVMEEKSAIFGYSIMMVGPDEAHILTFGIGAQWQKKGLGEKLLKYLIQLAGEEHAKSMLLDVRESNHGAAKLYKQLGFQQIATRKGYYPAMCGREDALVMRLVL